MRAHFSDVFLPLMAYTGLLTSCSMAVLQMTQNSSTDASGPFKPGCFSKHLSYSQVRKLPGSCCPSAGNSPSLGDPNGSCLWSSVSSRFDVLCNTRWLEKTARIRPKTEREQWNWNWRFPEGKRFLVIFQCFGPERFILFLLQSLTKLWWPRWMLKRERLYSSFV